MYKTNFQVSQGYVTLLIIIRSEFCDCYAHAQSIYILTMVQVSNHYLENFRRNCRDMNSPIMYDGWTHGHMKEGKTICPSPLCGKGIKKKFKMSSAATVIGIFMVNNLSIIVTVFDTTFKA